MERSRCISFVTMEIKTVLFWQKGRDIVVLFWWNVALAAAATSPRRTPPSKPKRISDWQSGFQGNFSSSGSRIWLTRDISSDGLIITMVMFQLCVRLNEIFDLRCPNFWVKSVWALAKASSSMYTAGLLAATKYCTFLMLQPRTYISRPHTAAVDLPTPALQWT